MLSNAYFLAKIRFDTAENEPAKNLQKQFGKTYLNSYVLDLALYDLRVYRALPRGRAFQTAQPTRTWRWAARGRWTRSWAAWAAEGLRFRFHRIKELAAERATAVTRSCLLR